MVGNDKPGLIDSIARHVMDAQGNWLASSFAHMAGHFAGFAEIQLPANQEKSLIDKLKSHPELKITLSEGLSGQCKDVRTAKIDIHGNDRRGIVQELTSVLNQFNLNITQFDSGCESAAHSGHTVFKARTQVELPEDLNTEELQSTLESLSDDLMVDIHL